MRWARYEIQTGDKNKLYWFLVGKPEGNRSLGRPKRKWINDVKINHRKSRIGWY
jgi:hypothetical protein